ncbi:hypothetical protein Tco_0302352, partial [Tanacetum coccineum]
RGRAGKEVKKTVKPQKQTKPKKTPSKQKQVLHDESSNSEGEPAKVSQSTEEPAAPKKASEQIERIPKVVVIQEPPSIHVKQTYESSGKHKGIEVLFDVAQLEIDTLKAQKASRRERRFQHQACGSSEGTGTKPGVQMS